MSDAGLLEDVPSNDPGKKKFTRLEPPQPRSESVAQGVRVEPDIPPVETNVGDMFSKAKAQNADAGGAIPGGYVREPLGGSAADEPSAQWPPPGDMGPVPAGPVKVTRLSEACAQWPQAMDPQSGFVMKVWRKDPKKVMYRNVDGYLGQYPLMDEDAFSRVIGGGKYQVQLWGPNARAGADPGTGEPRPYCYADFQVIFPGNIVAFPEQPYPMQPPYFQGGPFGGPGYQQPGYPQGQPGAYGQGFPPGYRPPGDPSAGASAAYGFAERMLDRQQQGGGGYDTLRFFGDMAARMGDMSKEQMGQMMEMMNGRLQAAESRAQQLEDRALNNQNQNPTVDFYGRVLDTQNLQAKLDDMHRRHNDDIESMRRRHEEDLHRRDSLNAQQLQIAQSAATDRENSMRREYGDRERLLTETFNARMTELERSYDRDKAAIRSDHENRVTSMRSDYDRALTAAEKEANRGERTQKEIHQAALAPLQMELERLRGDIAILRSENDNLKKQVFVAPEVALERGVKLARQVGMVHESEVKEEPTEKSPWFALAEKVAPAVAPGLLQMGGALASAAMAKATAPKVTPQPQPQQPQNAQAAALGQKPGIVGASAQQRGLARFRAPVQSMGEEGDDVSVTYDRPVPAGEGGEVVFMPKPIQQPAQDQAPAPQPQPQQPQQSQQAAPPESLPPFQAKGPPPAPPAMLPTLLQQIAMAATQAMSQGAQPEAFANALGAHVTPKGCKSITGWIDAENATVLLAHFAPDGGWDMAGPQKWLSDAWAALEKMGEGA